MTPTDGNGPPAVRPEDGAASDPAVDSALRNSTLVGLLDGLRAAPEGSRLLTPARGLAAALRAAARTARVAAAAAALVRWYRCSAIHRAGLAAAGRWVRRSYTYRWLAAEPEPEVVVVDLRETVTVGPWLAALDRALGAVVPGRRSSTVTAGLARLADGVAAAPVRALGLVVLAAAPVEFAATAATDSLSEAGALARVGLLALAALATRVDASWAALRASRPGRLVAAALAPPEPPADGPVDEREEE